MKEVLLELDLSWGWWLMAMLGSFLLGVAKGGMKGLGAIISTVMALVFGSKDSTGIVMPLLIVGDLFAVWYYNQHARWQSLRRLIPWMMVGVLIGVWYGKDLPEEDFKKGMAAIILVSVGLMWLLERIKSYQVPDNRFFAGIMGTVTGFTTMVGNLAGPFSELYFLAIRMPKEMFIGTAAWLFCITNFFKLPFHVLIWKTIHRDSLYVDLMLLPALILGLWAGIALVKVIRQQQFRHMIMVLTALGAILVFFR
jgi:uncharacterized membrane protein YfcA